MSGTTHAQRSRQWLAEQLEQLGALANAGPRDATFKAWRQSTLTVVQRVWPYDASRQDRFRRIRFTSPEPKADARKLAEWFAKASDDAATLIRQWIDEIERHGVPEPPKRASEGPTASNLGDDVPTIELGDAPRPRDSGGIVAREEIMLDLGGPSTGGKPRGERASASEPAPPTLHVKVPDKLAAPPRESKAPAAGSSGPARPAAGAKAPAAAKSPAAVKPAEPARPPATTKPAVEEKPTPARPAAQAPPAPASRAAARPATRTEPDRQPTPADRAPPSSPVARPPLGEMLGLEEVLRKLRHEEPPPTPETEAPEAPAPEPSGPSPTATSDEPERESEPAARSEPEPLAPDAPEAEPDPEPETLSGRDDDDAPDPEAFEAAARDFMFSSPVLSAQGKPVQRTPESPDFEHPDSLAIASLANEAVKLGVPEGQRATARALLIDLARCLEDGDPSWETLRDAVNWSMSHPELARRLLPVLLPWLDRAA